MTDQYQSRRAYFEAHGKWPVKRAPTERYTVTFQGHTPNERAAPTPPAPAPVAPSVPLSHPRSWHGRPRTPMNKATARYRASGNSRAARSRWSGCWGRTAAPPAPAPRATSNN
jgi:hypothetical protein